MPTELTKEVVAALHKEFDSAIADIARKHGFEFAPKKWTYSPLEGTVRGKLKFVWAGSIEKSANKNAELHGYLVKVGDFAEVSNRHSVKQKMKVVNIDSAGVVALMDEDGKEWRLKTGKFLRPLPKE